jgi:hypothetical protein
MQSLSIRKFIRHYDLDLIIASHAGIAVGDMVWDAAGIIPPKLGKPGAPRNVYNALELVGQITSEEREQLQKQAADLELVDAGLPNLNIHISAHHAGDFRYPLIAKVLTDIDVEKVSSFNFANVRARVMPHGMRLTTDRQLEAVKRSTWKEYDMTIRRSFIITELYYGSISVALDTKVATTVDVGVLLEKGFTLASKDTISRTEVYSMDVNGVPFAMRTEMARRFTS